MTEEALTPGINAVEREPQSLAGRIWRRAHRKLDVFPASPDEVEAKNASRRHRPDSESTRLGLMIDSTSFYAVDVQKVRAGGQGWDRSPDCAHVRIFISEMASSDRSNAACWMVVDEEGGIAFTEPSGNAAGSGLFTGMEPDERAERMLYIVDRARLPNLQQQFKPPIGHWSGQGAPVGAVNTPGPRLY
jgi:hypothetical protein